MSAKTAERPGRSIVLLLVLAACAAVFAARTFGLFFAADDFSYLPKNRPLQWPGLIDFFSHRFFARTVSFFLLDALFGLRPFFFHVVAALLHVANAWLLYRLLAHTLRFDPVHGAVAALMFVLHPVAYTPLAWIGLGFEECWPVLLALVAVQLVIPQLRNGGMWRGALASLLAVVAGGFKNYCIFFPIVIAAFALVDLHQGRYPRRQYLSRLTMALLPMIAFDVWYAMSVLPVIPQLDHPAYVRDYSLGSLVRSYSRLLQHALNPLAFGREALGYQTSLPQGFSSLIGDRAFVRLMLVAAVVALCFAAAQRVGRSFYAAAMAALMIALLFFAASGPSHLYQYCTYFSLPAACGIAALPVVWAVRAGPIRRWIARPPTIFMLAGALLLYAAAAGALLHRTNLLVVEAECAGAVDEYFARRAERDASYVFVPPSETAAACTLGGRSIKALHSDVGNVLFATVEDPQTPFVSGSNVQLVALDEIDDRGLQLYRLDHAQWRTDARIGSVQPGQSITQTFTVASDGLAEVHVRLFASYGVGDCGLELEVSETASDSDRPTLLASRTIMCRELRRNGYYALPLPLQASSAGKTYSIRITGSTSAHSTALMLPASSIVPPGFAALEQRLGAQGPAPAAVLAYRAVMKP